MLIDINLQQDNQAYKWFPSPWAHQVLYIRHMDGASVVVVIYVECSPHDLLYLHSVVHYCG